MGEPYRYKRKLVKIGNSFYILTPGDWLKAQAKKMKVRDFKEVIVEVYDDKLVILPAKQNMEEEEKKQLQKSLDEIKDMLSHFEQIVNIRIDKLKKVVGDYLEAGSNIALASVKANLKSV